MPRLIGYGEDGLTFRLMHFQLRDFLDRRGDHSEPSACTLFYRPSFGRAGGTESSQFGEFDSILSSQLKTYLIESKWDGSQVVIDGLVVLEPRQILRHRIFTWLWTQWHEQRPNGWSAFRQANGHDFGLAFGGKPMAPDGSTLARNLEHIFGHLAIRPSKPLEDVLVYFHREGSPVPTAVAPPGQGFVLVPFGFTVLGDSLYFEMS